MWAGAVLLFSLATVLSQSTDDNYRLVNITQGEVRGHLHPNGGLYTFYNIPYATAPTGTDRFKAPLAPATWINTFDAVDMGITCPQPLREFSSIQEDCLIANVFVPDTNASNLPVLVYVHGGAYQRLYGNVDELTTLVRTGQLIVVTFNYRLGAHGFLCLGTEGAPGNAGLKDQVALFRWVNTNIASFGGNPEDVTLLGCSAGGGSVDILTLSRTTNGLFNKAIIESGASFGAVGVQMEPVRKAQDYARILNFTNVDDLEALEEFYKTIPIEMLYSHYGQITNREDATILFAPCVERDIGEERVIGDAPINIIRQGNYNRIPLLLGFSNMEGLMRLSSFDRWKDRMNVQFADFLPGELTFDNEVDKERVAATVREFYFGDQPVSEQTVLSFIDYFTDITFAYPMLMALKARKESLNETIYLYEYSFVDENSPSIPYSDAKGADHCDQTIAILDEDETNITEEYRRMKAVMREYLLNFILTSVPSVDSSELPVWLPTGANRAPYMSLGPTIELKSSILNEERVALWDNVYDQFYRGQELSPAAAGSLIISNIMIACILVLFYFAH